MAALTVASISRSGVTITAVAANAGGDTFANTGKEVLFIKNASGSPITVSFAFGVSADAMVDGISPPARTCVVAAGAQTLAGPFPPNKYNDVNGNVAVTYSGVTTLTVQPIQVI